MSAWLIMRSDSAKSFIGLPEDGYLIKTIVTTNLADAIADRTMAMD